jgi:hypothetical protein
MSHNFSKALIPLVLLTILSYINSLSFYNDGTYDKCFYKTFADEEDLDFSYMISGEVDNNFKVVILDPSSNELYSSIAENEGDFKKKIVNAGEYQLCFFPNEKGENSITFDFVGEHDSGHLIKVAKGQELNDMQKDIVSISTVFEEIKANINYIVERQTVHSESKFYFFISITKFYQSIF